MPLLPQSFLLSCALSAPAAAQNAGASPAGATDRAGAEKSGAEKPLTDKSGGEAGIKLDTNVDPAKKKAIKELLTLTKMTENFNAIRDVMLAQVRRTINTLVQKQINDDPKTNSTQKKAMLDTFSDSSDRIINRYRDLFSQRVDMPDIMEQVAYKVYDESFTTSEIQDLINFYRTATGQKALKEMPEIIQRSMLLSTQLIQPKVVEIVKEVVSEEIGHLRTDAVSRPASRSSSAASVNSAASTNSAAPTSYAGGPATSAPANIATPAQPPSK